MPATNCRGHFAIGPRTLERRAIHCYECFTLTLLIISVGLLLLPSGRDPLLSVNPAEAQWPVPDCNRPLEWLGRNKPTWTGVNAGGKRLSRGGPKLHTFLGLCSRFQPLACEAALRPESESVATDVSQLALLALSVAEKPQAIEVA